MPIERVNVNDDGTLNEIVGTGRFHLERLSDEAWFLDLDGLSMTLGVGEPGTKVTAMPSDLISETAWARWDEAIPLGWEDYSAVTPGLWCLQRGPCSRPVAQVLRSGRHWLPTVWEPETKRGEIVDSRDKAMEAVEQYRQEMGLPS